MASQQSLPKAEQVCQDGPCEQSPSMTVQATAFIQQTGEQVKNMAQGAAEAVKNTLGITDNNAPDETATTNLATANVPGSAGAPPPTKI